jgi:hypothetical protein
MTTTPDDILSANSVLTSCAQSEGKSKNEKVIRTIIPRYFFTCRFFPFQGVCDVDDRDMKNELHKLSYTLMSGYLHTLSRK